MWSCLDSRVETTRQQLDRADFVRLSSSFSGVCPGCSFFSHDTTVLPRGFEGPVLSVDGRVFLGGLRPVMSWNGAWISTIGKKGKFFSDRVAAR